MTLLQHARSLAHDLLDLVAPARCVACDDPHPARPPLCARCDEHLLPAEDAPPGVSVPFAHGGPLARAIYRAKYDGDPAVAVALGRLLAEHAEVPPGRYAWVVPVPLHGARLRARGYNQAYELGRALARRLGAPLATDLVARVRDTPTQTRLDRDARRRNVADAFAIREGAAVRGRCVVVLDDVVTTGATLDALRDVLVSAGAERVEAVALSRAPLHLRAR